VVSLEAMKAEGLAAVARAVGNQARVSPVSTLVYQRWRSTAGVGALDRRGMPVSGAAYLCGLGLVALARSALFLHEKRSRAQGRVHEGNERHHQIVEIQSTARLKGKIHKQTPDYGEDDGKKCGHVMSPMFDQREPLIGRLARQARDHAPRA
jgi:hypothetical protein